MKTSAVLIALLLFGLCTRAEAEDIPYDDLLRAMDQTGKELVLGNERKEILARLNKVIDDNPKSSYLERAKGLSADLSLSLTKPVTAPNESIPLMETTIPISQVPFSSDWKLRFQHFLREHPRDPMSVILSSDREVIESLIPKLDDTSPTRAYHGSTRVSGYIPTIPRVCDMALLVIEFHSQCQFHFNASSRQYFHELSKEDRAKKKRHIEKWWAENKAKPLAVGIRSQIPHADIYGKVWMAKNLANLSGKEDHPDREYAIQLLKTFVQENWGHRAVHAANALAELDDFSSVEVFYTRYQKTLDHPGRIYVSDVVWYLTDYGGRREWELLNQLAQREIDQGLERGTATIWSGLLNCNKSKSSLYAVPGLALALTQTRTVGNRLINSTESQPYSCADEAVERLQKLTGVDFGYSSIDSVDARAAAIQKALQWWQTEGNQTYTFDKIEKMMDEKDQSRLKQ